MLTFHTIQCTKYIREAGVGIAQRLRSRSTPSRPGFDGFAVLIYCAKKVNEIDRTHPEPVRAVLQKNPYIREALAMMGFELWINSVGSDLTFTKIFHTKA